MSTGVTTIAVSRSGASERTPAMRRARDRRPDRPSRRTAAHPISRAIRSSFTRVRLVMKSLHCRREPHPCLRLRGVLLLVVPPGGGPRRAAHRRWRRQLAARTAARPPHGERDRGHREAARRLRVPEWLRRRVHRCDRHGRLRLWEDGPGRRPRRRHGLRDRFGHEDLHELLGSPRRPAWT